MFFFIIICIFPFHPLYTNGYCFFSSEISIGCSPSAFCGRCIFQSMVFSICTNCFYGAHSGSENNETHLNTSIVKRTCISISRAWEISGFVAARTAVVTKHKHVCKPDESLWRGEAIGIITKIMMSFKSEKNNFTKKTGIFFRIRQSSHDKRCSTGNRTSEPNHYRA